MSEQCEHGSWRPHDCALCRWRRYGEGDYRNLPLGQGVPMPAWFRAMLEDYRVTGVMSVPPDRLEFDRRYRQEAHDDRPRYC